MKRLFAISAVLLFVVGILFAANEIHVNYDTGATLYFVRFNSAGQAGLSNGSSFENWVAADTYDVAMAEVGSGGGHYIGSWGSVAAGRYSFTVFKRAGANPANGDEKIAIGDIVWSGTAELFGPTKADINDVNVLIDALYRRFIGRIGQKKAPIVGDPNHGYIYTFNDANEILTTQEYGTDPNDTNMIVINAAS